MYGYQLAQETNGASIAYLTDLLAETQTELEKYKSSRTAGRLEQRRALMRDMSLTLHGPDSAASSKSK